MAKNTSNTTKRGRPMQFANAPKPQLALHPAKVLPTVYHKDGYVYSMIRPGVYHRTPLAAIADYYKA